MTYDPYPRLIEPIRQRVERLSLPYIIENVAGAALHDPVVLCGSMFRLCAIDEDGMPLELERHRHFETNWELTAPDRCNHGWYSPQVAGCYGGARRVKKWPGDTLVTLAPRDRSSAREERGGGYVPRSARVQSELLGVDWMTQHGRYQSVPPAYTEHIGRQLIDHLNACR